MKFDFGCDEYQTLTRRSLFSGLGVPSIRSLAPGWLPMVSFDVGDGPIAKDVIVSIYLRGGADGLSLCVPFGDPEYYKLRTNLAIKRPDENVEAKYKCVDLDGFFGLPASMSPLKEVFDAGDFAVVHATGSSDPTRSHFDAQQIMESASVDQKVWTGWLGRHLALSSPMKAESLMRGIALSGTLPLTLEGSPNLQIMTDPNSFGLGGDDNTRPDRRAALTSLYGDVDDLLKTAARNTFATMDALEKLKFQDYKPEPGTEYNTNDPFNVSLESAAALIKGDVGVEAVHIDYGSWDTHAGQNPMEPGYGMAQLMENLARGLSAFYKDLQPKGFHRKVTVVVMSEFGRQAGENTANGTDHGHGNVMFLMGGNVGGKKVYSQWPTLTKEKLYDGRDLAVTIDYRDVLCEVVGKRLSNAANLAAIFPGFTPTDRGMIKS